MDLVPVDFDGGRAPAPASAATVAAHFAERGVQPPAAYVAFAIANGGKRFSSSDRYVRNDDTGEIVGIGTVYHYDDGLILYSVKDVWAQTKTQLPDGLVPIATSEFGGQICLDYRQDRANPAVVLFDYDAEPDEEIGLLATSFDAFVKSIGPNPEV